MLKQNSIFPGITGPVVSIVLDGFGINPTQCGNAIYAAHTPVLDKLVANHPHTDLWAHGTWVGMPSDQDMGNSEVGHNAMGSGQIIEQGASLVKRALADGSMFAGPTWNLLLQNTLAKQSTLHFIGLFSDGNVHSHIDHLQALIAQAKKQQQRRIRIHILLDGRDVGETSALDYVEPFEEFLKALADQHFDCCIASGGGRMQITMDRYEADWKMVEKGWRTHVLGQAAPFPSTTIAINTLRAEHPGVIDQDLPPFVITRDGAPVGTIQDNDSVVFFNFRGDRAIEISRAFEDQNFDHFDRQRYPKQMLYAGMLQYDGDLNIPNHYLVAPPIITNTMGEYLTLAGVTQLAIAETQKFGHVTYFWNGNRSSKFDEHLEHYIEIPSDTIPFEQRPWMQSAQITDRLIQELKTRTFRFLRVNFANCDMVGHTGNFAATVVAIEAVDLALGRLLPLIDSLDGLAIITADHGNADEMFELDKKTGLPKIDGDGKIKAKTSHTLNPVPCIFYGLQRKTPYKIKNKAFGLSNLAATTVNLLGFETPPLWDESMLQLK